MKHEKRHKEKAPETEVKDLPVEETTQEAAPEEIVPEEAKSPEEELKEQLAKAEEQRDEYLDLAQRVQAEFENFRRRNANVRKESFEDGTRAFIKTILPVCDNLERALEADGDAQSLKEGVRMVYRQLEETLEKQGVEKIDRVGDKFDPQLEDAVVQGNPEEGEPGTVCEVYLKGYKMGDHVLRHAMVKVVPEN
ncbi:MAG TPA: nucleotide exchange factor GrpE [Clostridiales bacterium]|nr:nucleotide exchange factor GrpE [Clostridiales bacterium]